MNWLSQIKGRLIVVEGPDGVGKTTLAKQLVKELKAIYWQFPGQKQGTLGYHIYNLHHCYRDEWAVCHGDEDERALKGIKAVDPCALQLLHVAAHIDTLTAYLVPLLEKGETVVLDRWWWSTWVYGRVLGVRRELIKAMTDLERKVWGYAGVAPEQVFLVSRSVSLRKGMDPLLHRQLTAEYNRLASRFKGSVARIKNNGARAHLLDTVRWIAERL